MKLPSLEYIVRKSSFTLKRFPLAIASATLAALTAVYLAELNYEQTKNADHLYSLIMVSALGISLFTVITLICEKREWNKPLTIVANTAGVTVLVFYYFLLPEDFSHAPDYHLFRYMLYFLTAHLLVAFGPYWNIGGMSGFWQYNKTLFLRFLTAVLFSGVLYIGLAIALGSIDVLLGVEIDGKRYVQLFALIAGIFNTWFFLAGIPASMDDLEYVKDYPKGLKIFTQNILIPLVIIYLVILYLYTGKIILEWTWPEGWVAYLVLSFSIVGIFALLLLHPIQEKVENRWIKRFSQSYFWVLVPLVILLLLAIWVRIEEYSFTANRYFVLVLGLWLAGIVAYFIASKTKNIKVIPASLCIIAFLISFGPWGAFSVSEQSQVNRLQQYLEKNDILKEGSIHKASEPVAFEDRKEISSIIRYLNDMHGLSGIQPWFEEDLSNLAKPALNSDTTRIVNRYEKPQYIAGLMGIEYVNEWESSTQNYGYRQFSSNQQEILSLEGYDWLVSYNYYQSSTAGKELSLSTTSLHIHTEPDQAILKLTSGRNGSDTLRVEIAPLIEYLSKNYTSATSLNISPEEMVVKASNETISSKIYISSLNVSQQDSTPKLINLNGKILLKIKN